MKEKGMIIYEDGKVQSFGTYFYPDEPMRMFATSHEVDFISEIVPSALFRTLGYTYNFNLDLYHNIPFLCFDGLVIALNKQKSTISPTECLIYVPECLTEEQKTSIEENQTLSNIEIQDVREYHSYDYNDYTKHASLKDYIASKKPQSKI